MSMEKIWFILRQNIVTGPYTPEEITSRLEKNDSDNSLRVWCRELTNWKKPEWWHTNSHQLNLAIQSDIKADPETWFYFHKQKVHGPMQKNQMINEIALIEDFKDLLYKSEEGKEWDEIFNNDQLLHACNISKRSFPRASIDGFLKIIKDQKAVTLGQLRSVSEGGCAASGVTAIKKGDHVTLLLKSSSLYQEFLIKAEVRYITQDGMAGFQFSDTNSTIKSIIRDFVELKIAEESRAI